MATFRGDGSCQSILHAMTRLRRLGLALWLALALLVGQQAVVLHDLGHARESLAGQRDSQVPQKACDEHFICAQLASAVGTSLPVVPPVAAPGLDAGVFLDAVAPAARHLAFRSRAPPTLL
jgi:hypothetical protein